MYNRRNARKVLFLLCSLLSLLVSSEALVPPISGEIGGAITADSSLYILSDKTVRRYDPGTELPVWTRTFPGSKVNIGFDEDFNLVVANLNSSALIPANATVEVVEKSTGNTALDKAPPVVDLKNESPEDLNDFVVAGGNLTGIFRRLHPLFRFGQFVSLPANRIFSLRLEVIAGKVFSGVGSEFVIAFYNGKLNLAIEDPALPTRSFRSNLERVGGPLNQSFSSVAMAAHAGSDALYLAGFSTMLENGLLIDKPSDALHVYRFKLSTLQSEWVRALDTPRQTGGGVGITIGEDGDQVVLAALREGESAGAFGDVVVNALDAASGSSLWEVSLETPGRDSVHSAHSLADGVIAVVGALNQDGEGNAAPVCFLNRTGPL